MGYDLHITHREDWADDDGPAISREEFERVVLGDPEFRRDDGLGPDFAVWTRSREPDGEWVCWDARGELVTKHPSALFIAKLGEIAAKLDARLIGDDGERYDAATGEPARERAAPRALPWWSIYLFVFLASSIVCIALVLLGVI